MALGRAHYSSYLIDLEGQPLGEATVTLYDQGTTTPITPTIYANDTDGTTLANPMTASATGKIEFYLAGPGRYSMKVEKSGYTTTTEVIDVLFSTVGSAHVIREDGVAQTVRGALMFFGNDFDLSDDAVDNETVLKVAAALARLAGTNTWTGANTFSAAAVFSALLSAATGGDKGVKVGTAMRVLQVGSDVYVTFNAEHNGTNWIRLLADNDASAIVLAADGTIQFYANSDGGSTVGSTITFAVTGSLSKAGLLSINTLTAPIITTEAWVAFTFAGAWGNAGGGYETGAYFKDPFGIVHLKGAVTGGALGSTITTLPAGYRPAAHRGFATTDGSGAGEVEVRSDGVVKPVAGAVAQISLDGITFKAA